MQKLQGWVEEGNTTLAISGAAGTIARKVQGSFPSATVTAYINNPPAVAISSISRTANVVTVTIPTNSGFIAGQLVTIAGVTDASFNGTFTILTSGATTFTYAQVAANTSSSSGTASSTLRLATIYSDNALTPKANPFVSAADATWFFYAANGAYDVKFSGAGIPSPFTIGGLWLFDESSVWIDVKSSPYLAVGDGVADDTAAIQAAISSITPGTGATVYIPPGTYKMTSTLTSASRAVNLVGAGRAASILVWPNTGVDGWTIASNCRVANLTLRGPNALSVGHSGLDTGGVSDVLVEDCIIEQWGEAAINTGGSSVRFVVRGNILRNNFAQGVFIAGATTDSIIDNNEIYGNISNGIDCNGSRNVFSNNQVRANGGSGGAVDSWGILIGAIPGFDANYNVVIGNIVTGNAAQGIILKAASIGQTVNYNVVSGNICSGNSGSSANGDGIALDGSSAGTMTGNIIIGNTCQGNQRHGIDIDGSVATVTENMVANNTCIGNTNTGIIGSGDVDTQVLGNTCLGNGTQILLVGTRTTQVANKIQTSNSNLEIVAANLETGSSFTSGMLVKSAANTEVRLTSSGGGHAWAFAIDTSGNCFLFDQTSVLGRLKIDTSGVVYTPYGLSIGSGTPITVVLGTSGTLNFPNTAAQSASDLTIALTGALPGYPVQVSPSAGAWASSGVGFYVAACLANDVVTVRFVNPSAGAIDPPSGVFVIIQTRI